MMSGSFASKTAVPWWAAFGAPLLGVPVLVALLALGSMGREDVGAGSEVDAGYAIEEPEALQAGARLPAVTFEAGAEARC